jgi:ATP-dependent helicase HrpA
MTDIRSQLGPEHTTNVVEVEDKTWKQDGLTEWNWGELPKKVTIRRGVTELAAFPAIVDQADAVGLRLLDSRAAADQTTRQGLVRLLQIKFRKSLRSQVNWLPELDQHAVRVARLVPANEFKKQLSDLITRIAFVDRDPIPRTDTEFNELTADATERISVATLAVSKWLPNWTSQTQTAFLKLEQTPDRFGSAKGDIRQQIKNLTGEHFLSTTPWTWLEHYPRYFQAITLRLEKLSSTPPDQERRMREELAEWWKIYAELKDKHAQLAIVDPELDHLRWMIEEYRVSLFAQQLGTSLTVSAKRLEKQLKKVRQV